MWRHEFFESVDQLTGFLTQWRITPDNATICLINETDKTKFGYMLIYFCDIG